MVYDSSGIRLVVSVDAAWLDHENWILEEEPVLEFGSQYDLHRVRGALRLAGGRIVIAHASASEFLIIAPEGAILERHGKRGAGPGEFMEITYVFRGAADSLAVLDVGNGLRTSVLAPDGRFERAFAPVSLPDGRMSLLQGVFGDGSLLVTPVGGPPSGEGLTRRQRELWRIRPEHDESIQLVRYPEEEMFFFSGSAPGPVAWRRPFFGRTGYHVAGPDRLYWGSTDEFSIYVHNLNGELVSIYRRQQEPRRFSSNEVTRIEQSIIDGAVPEIRPAWRRTLSELPRSGVVPAFGWPDFGPTYGEVLQVDADGNLWVAEYYMPNSPRNARSVFDSSGIWLGTVELPLGFSPTHIDTNHILGVWRDEFGVEFVRLYRLFKPRRQSVSELRPGARLSVVPGHYLSTLGLPHLRQ